MLIIIPLGDSFICEISGIGVLIIIPLVDSFICEISGIGVLIIIPLVDSFICEISGIGVRIIPHIDSFIRISHSLKYIFHADSYVVYSL